MDGLEAARRLYSAPPEAEATGDGASNHVPEAVLEAFERAYELGKQSPDQIEALITGLRAGTRDKQRERCGGRA